jgi:hypothetical protein
VIPLKDAISFLVGLQLIDLFGMEGLEARFEHAQSSSQSFTHNQFYRGHWTRGAILSHFIGADGSDYYWRITRRLGEDLMVGVELNRSVIGSTVNGFAGPKEERTGGSLDLSYRLRERYALFAQYQVMKVKNRGFRSGDDGLDHLLRVDLTRSFR